MTTMDESRQIDLREQITRLDGAIAETAKYAAKQRELEAEARNLDRNRWQIVVIAMTGGAALFSKP
jgi:hypothetical protein